jgi:hypothetical protein
VVGADCFGNGKWRKVKLKVNPHTGIALTRSFMLAPASMRLCNNAQFSRFFLPERLFCRVEPLLPTFGPGSCPGPHRSPWTATRCVRPMASRPRRPSLRKEGEGYVLHTDVEEVVLNCTVLERQAVGPGPEEGKLPGLRGRRPAERSSAFSTPTCPFPLRWWWTTPAR